MATLRIRNRSAVAVSVAALIAAGGLLAPAAAESGTPQTRAVVLVSGTAATTPFTTPTQACGTGYSAGNTWAYLRDFLTQRGYRVFTAPASIGGGTVQETKNPVAGPFADCPAQLPASMTINAIGAVDQSGANLGRFIAYLRSEYGITDVDVVGHSLGGLIGRAGLREAKLNGVPVRFTSYTTLGSPWASTLVANLDPRAPLKGCDGEPVCQGFIRSLLPIPGIQMLIANLSPANEPVWNRSQIGVLDGIPVTLMAGTYFTKKGGSPKRWPNDGVIERRSALATTTPDAVIPHRTCVAFPLTHSISVTKVLGIPDANALTWNPKVGEALAKALDRAPAALGQPNRTGCPKAS